MNEVIIILAINAIITLIFCIKSRGNKHLLVFAIMFIIVPILGFLMYFIPQIIYGIRKRKNYYDKDDLISRSETKIHSYVPKIEDELNIIPFEEALAVSHNNEKRGLLLDILKKGMQDNYKVAKSALEDIDSETSHYAAAAAMEISRKMRLNVQELEMEFMKNKSVFTNRRSFIDGLYQYIDSGVLSSRDRILNINKYIKLMKESVELYNDLMLQTDYVHLIEFLIELSNIYDAEKIARERKCIFPDEDIYMKLLEIYFILKNKEEFDKTFIELRKSNVVLSSKGLEKVRFWVSRV